MLHATPTILQLREMILNGVLEPGERVKEASLAEQLGVSRMPVRQALPVLAQEGLLVRAGNRGYAVRAFTPGESQQALRLRGALESFAARALAERGAPEALLAQMEACLATGDALLSARSMTSETQIQYAEMNATFHELLVGGTGSGLLESFVMRCNLVPFVSPGSVAFGHTDRNLSVDLLTYAHRQHHAIVEAIRRRQGDRAEFLCREHIVTQEYSMAHD
ncbi:MULTISPECIES: GntR family transcriptional regulator [Paraburkholderia]|uniref:GntR family transcriptional regulator n=1 Tax=Paraburkholderia podalyriae TaxID=1938811 RepID=A0ABR7PTD6_9BURK|nr:GntR family transcriptional regulator [Paraburkholderia podalyriae]MBC8749552.1 GntR family transcriptional regulator [Paraburkholderia podalyriae]